MPDQPEKTQIENPSSGTIETPGGGHPPVAPRGGSEDEVLPAPPPGLAADETAQLRYALTVYSMLPDSAVDDVLAEVVVAVERILHDRRISTPPAGGEHRG